MIKLWFNLLAFSFWLYTFGLGKIYVWIKISVVLVHSVKLWLFAKRKLQHNTWKVVLAIKGGPTTMTCVINYLDISIKVV